MSEKYVATEIRSNLIPFSNYKTLQLGLVTRKARRWLLVNMVPEQLGAAVVIYGYNLVFFWKACTFVCICFKTYRDFL